MDLDLDLDWDWRKRSRIEHGTKVLRRMVMGMVDTAPGVVGATSLQAE